MYNLENIEKKMNDLINYKGLYKLFNQKILSEELHFIKELEKISQELNLDQHVAILSSGTTSSTIKGYIFTKAALLENAKAVNSHLQLNPESDLWGVSLPTSHLSGASIMLRSYCLNKKIIDCGKWQPEKWVKLIQENAVTVTSLVPSQLYDLIKNQMPPPQGLKKCIIGGDFLAEHLYQESIKLHWPILRTYGMTEAGPQIATENALGSGLKILPIHQCKTNEQNLLSIKSPSLFLWEFQYDLKTGLQLKSIASQCDKLGFYQTKDLVNLDPSNSSLEFLGRNDSVVKSSGRLIYLSELKNIVEKFAIENSLYKKIELTLEKDEKKSYKLVISMEENIGEVRIQKSLCDLLKPHQVDLWKVLPSIPRTDLGKMRTRP